jgi:hypothetical protein
MRGQEKSWVVMERFSRWKPVRNYSDLAPELDHALQTKVLPEIKTKNQ